MRVTLLSLVLILAACGGSSPDEGVEEAGASTTIPTSDEPSTASTVVIEVDVESLGTEHIDPPATFEHSPPIGGDHYGFWQNCGFYDVELIEGAAAHTLEHGAVWITYNASKLSEEEVSTLASIAAGNGKVLASPYPHDEKLVLSAWGIQLRSEYSPADAEVQAFIDEWIDNPELAEAGVRCTGAAGIPPSDVRSLADGTQVPDEFQ